MKLVRILRVAAALGAFTTAAPGVSAARASEAPGVHLTIAFTGDVSGYLEPCG